MNMTWHYYNHMNFWGILMFTGVPSDPNYGFFRDALGLGQG